MGKLNLDQHVAHQYNGELEAVRSKVLQMGGVVEEQLVRATRSLVEFDVQLAREVIDNDARINSLEVEIDEECTRIMARSQPAASDLRLVLAVIKTINDLERIGDEVKRVGKMVCDEMRGALDDSIRLELEHMAELVRKMLTGVLDAFARTDVQSAAEVARTDYKVDIKYTAITRQLVTYMAEDPTVIPVMLNVLWAARSIERMGDRCQNIAEYVIYLVLGVNVSHVALDDIMAEIKLVPK